MNEPLSDLLTTREAAGMLGVGTTTIKRWADTGQIACVRTAGGHRRFPQSAVLALRRRGVGAPEPAAPDVSRVERWLSALVHHRGSVPDLAETLDREHDERGSWAAVGDALGSVLDELGRRWETGGLSVIAEHVAAERLVRAVEACGPRPGSDAPCCALVAAQNDDHTLGLALVELAAREAGWRALWIGRRAPTAELCAFVADAQPEAVAVSASSYSIDTPALAAQAERLGAACRRAGSLLVVGGRGAWPDALAYGYRLHTIGELAQLLDGQRM